MPRTKIKTDEELKQNKLEYAKKNYKRVPLDMPIDDYEQLKALCDEKGIGVNPYIKQAISEKMARDKK